MNKFLAYFGYGEDLPPNDRFAYIITGYAAAIVGSFLALYLIFIPSFLANFLIFICFSLLFVVLLLLRAGHSTGAKVLLSAAFMIQELFLVLFLFPSRSNLQYFFFLIAPVTFTMYDFEVKRERILTMLTNGLAGILLLICELFPTDSPLVPLPPAAEILFTALATLSTFGTMTLVFYAYANKNSLRHRELDLLAQTDGLTGIYNRRALFSRGERLFRECRHSERTFSLLLFDLDHFKRINDTYGHSAGDLVLKEVTGIISTSIRERDFFARYGGEEFALILCDLSPSSAGKVAENLRRKTEEHSIAWNGERIFVTISLGISSLSSAPESFGAMIRGADEALYRAKAAGRNRVENVPIPASGETLP